MDDNLSNFSSGTLETIKVMLGILVQTGELSGFTETIKIPIKKFEKEGLFYGDIFSIINMVCTDKIRIRDDSAACTELALTNDIFPNLGDTERLSDLRENVVVYRSHVFFYRRFVFYGMVLGGC